MLMFLAKQMTAGLALIADEVEHNSAQNDDHYDNYNDDNVL